MSKKSKIYLIVAFICCIFGALWFLTDDIKNLATTSSNLAPIVGDVFKLVRTIVYMVWLILSFIGLLNNKKLPLIYFVTLIFISFYTLYWLPEFFEYIVSLFEKSNYVVTKILGFSFTCTGVCFITLFYDNAKKDNNL